MMVEVGVSSVQCGAVWCSVVQCVCSSALAIHLPIDSPVVLWQTESWNGRPVTGRVSSSLTCGEQCREVRFVRHDGCDELVHAVVHLH
jgi:hypothetical protein